MRDWESPSQRRGRDQADPERHIGRTNGRKDGSRTYDVIEIETKPYNLKPGPNDEYNISRNADDQSGVKGNNRMVGRGGRVWPIGRDGQQVNRQVPMGSPFGPPGGLQPLTPTMSPRPGPPMSPAVFIPPFSPAVVWPGVGIPPGGPSGPRFPPNIGTPQNPNMYFHQPGPLRGIMPPNMPGPGFNALGLPMGPTPRLLRETMGHPVKLHLEENKMIIPKILSTPVCATPEFYSGIRAH
ncbi:hypothetical protein Hanom_Chr12g01104761 [Helianthus anomalus]